MSRLEELEARIAALESGAEGESLSANYLTIDPATKVIGATFTGLLKALGLIIQAGTANSPANTSRVIWSRADGAAVANIYATEVLGRDIFQAGADAANATNVARSQYFSSSLSGGRLAGIMADAAADSGGVSSVTVVTDGVTTDLLDSNGNSNFLQAAKNLADLISAATARTNLGLGSAAVQPTTAFAAANSSPTFNSAPNASQLLWGQITAQVGPTITGGNSGGMTVTRNGAGLYTIGFPAFRNTGYGFVAMPVGAGSAFMVGGSKTASQIQIGTNSAGGVASDINFLFIAAGLT